MVLYSLFFIPSIFMLFYAGHGLKKNQALPLTIVLLFITLICSWTLLYTQGLVWHYGEEKSPDWLFNIRGWAGSMIIPFAFLSACSMIGKRLMSFTSVVLFLLSLMNLMHYGVISFDASELDGYIDPFRIAFYYGGVERFNLYNFEVPMIIQGIWLCSRIIYLLKELRAKGYRPSADSKYAINEYGIAGCAILITIFMPNKVWTDYPASRVIYSAVFNLMIGIYLYFVGRGFMLIPMRDENEEPVVIDVNPRYSLIGDHFQNLIDKEHIYLTQGIRLEDVARTLGTNRTYVAEMIKRNYDTTFAALMNNLRIDEAKKLLVASPESKLEEIAYKSGFSTASTFTKAFKTATGLTPSAWLSAQKKEEDVAAQPV